MLDVKFFEFGGKRVLRYLVAGRGARRCDKLIPRRFWAVTLRGAPMSGIGDLEAPISGGGAASGRIVPRHTRYTVHQLLV